MTCQQAHKEQNKRLQSLLSMLERQNDLQKRLHFLEKEPLVAHFLLNQDHPLVAIYTQLNDVEKVAVSSIIAIGQAENIFRIPKYLSNTPLRLQKLISELVIFEQFYQEIGGIIGYHLKVLELIFQNQAATDPAQIKTLHQAQGISLHENKKETDHAVIAGIEALPHMGELYPIGGAGDRLDLRDEKTGLALPTAKLNYLGQSLLTCMIKDLQSREYLYFKLFDTQLTTPIAMMTSEAKNNHQFIEQICKENHWYHRPKESFRLFKQPLAPVITTEGQWSMSDHLKLYLKPSGHGVIWKLARDEGIFEWFAKQDRSKVLLRQMNNPMAGTDNGIFALIGLGHSGNKAFGFASCQRHLHAAEGVNVLTEQKKSAQFHYAVSNIEYTEFDKYHLKDTPSNSNSPYSLYPANTNILFIDLNEVQKALKHCSIPGMLINMKTKVPYLDESGHKKMTFGGRLESTMQNIADYMCDTFDHPQNIEDRLNLKTFLTYNVRRKTISVAKKTYKGDGNINETPEGCYYHLQQNNFELLTKFCNCMMPDFPTVEDYLQKGPSNHILFHPALGPLYSVISQKIQKGKLHLHSELILEISELELFNLELDGSCIIASETLLGHLDESKIIKYSHRSGKCSLINVKIKNQGIHKSNSSVFWRNQIERQECFKLYLEENAEFHAENVIFNGSFDLRVPKNQRMEASMDAQGNVTFKSSPISDPSWYWHYKIDPDHQQVLLSKKTKHPRK